MVLILTTIKESRRLILVKAYLSNMMDFIVFYVLVDLLFSKTKQRFVKTIVLLQLPLVCNSSRECRELNTGDSFCRRPDSSNKHHLLRQIVPPTGHSRDPKSRNSHWTSSFRVRFYLARFQQHNSIIQKSINVVFKSLETLYCCFLSRVAKTLKLAFQLFYLIN